MIDMVQQFGIFLGLLSIAIALYFRIAKNRCQLFGHRAEFGTLVIPPGRDYVVARCKNCDTWLNMGKLNKTSWRDADKIKS